MLKPDTVQLPDYSKFVKKEFIITEDIEMKKSDIGRPMLKGTRFVIKKIIDNTVTIKISNTKEELEKIGMLEYDFNRVINQSKKDLLVLKKVCNMWEDDSDKFIVDKNSVWNKPDYSNDQRGGHCINTSYYGIPSDHPDKYGSAKAWFNDKGKYVNSDCVMTIDYKRTDGKVNIYSFQKGQNIFYSKNCYGFIIKGIEEQLAGWEKRIPYYKKWVFDWIFGTKEISIKTLNKMTFKPYK